tara:strand:- start:385 stop:1287 length:903 start_codon:yes stop_codon:yes gene_type:complete
MTKKYVLISFFGGIGDQIFQFSFANYLKNKLKCEVYVDLSYYQSSLNYNKLSFRLKSITKKKFQIKKNLLKINFRYLSYIRFLSFIKLDYLFSSINNIFFNKKVDKFIYEYSQNNKKYQLLTKSFYYGYWHNLKYLKDLKKFINQNLVKDVLKNKNIQKFINSKINDKTICLHIRGGDYKWVKSHNTLESKYYIDSINFFIRKIKNPTFHIYTNDIIFAKKIMSNLLNNYKHEYMKDYKFSDIDEFSLFGVYKYSIIANSTFSLLSSYISKNNLISIAPKNWSGDKKLNKKKTFERMIFL